jgi:hypothetical protein
MDPTTIDALVRDSGCMARLIAPEFRATPLYILTQSRLPPEYRVAGCDGFVSATLDLELRDVIGPDWRGRGGCIVVEDDAPAVRGRDYAEARLWFRSLVAHELAHLLEWPTPFLPFAADAQPSREYLHDRSVATAARLSDPDRAAVLSSHNGHGVEFFRVLLHLRHRAEGCGFELEPWKFLLGPGVGSRAEQLRHYEDALGDELYRLRSAPFAEIKAAPVPMRMVGLWMDDMGLHPGNDAVDRLIAGAS